MEFRCAISVGNFVYALPFMRNFFFSWIIFTVSDTALWKIFDVTDRCRKMICTGRRMTRELCIRVEFICKQRGRWQIDAGAGGGSEGNGVVGCVLTKLARNYFQPGNFGGHRKDWLLRVHCENCLCWENKSRVCAGVLKYASLSRRFVSGNKRKENQLDYPNKELRVPCFIGYIYAIARWVLQIKK